MRLVRLKRTGSTMDVARRLATEGTPEWTVVVAEEQTGGRGRLWRRWASPRGGLWLSIVLRPKFPPSKIPLVGLAASLALVKAIRKKLGVRTGLKWPNDVLLNGRKLAGILSEAFQEDGKWVVILGIGVNTNVRLADLPEEVRCRAAALIDVLGRPVDNWELLRELIRELRKAYRLILEDPRILAQEWNANSVITGLHVKVATLRGEVEGVALGVDEAGRLILQVKDREIRISQGEVTLLRPA